MMKDGDKTEWKTAYTLGMFKFYKKGEKQQLTRL